MAKKAKKELTPEERLAAARVPKEEWLYELPEGWEWVRLGEVNQYKSCSIDPKKFPDEIFELYSVPSSADNYPEIIEGSEIGSSKQAVQEGDVLLCKINPRINRVWKVSQYTDHPLLASSEWIVVRNDQINSNYLMRYFQSDVFRKYMLSNVSGVGGSLMRAQPKFVKTYPVPLPPLETQQRIVDQIESLFAKLDQAKEKAQQALATSETRKAAILHQAFTGQLTAQWREENISDKNDILEQVKEFSKEWKIRDKRALEAEQNRAVMVEKENGHQWVKCTIGAVARVCNGSTPSRKETAFWNGEIFWVSSGEVKDNIIYETKERISQEGYKSCSVNLLPVGTVLIAMIGEGKTRGRSAILQVPATINQNIAAIIVDHGMIAPKYLQYWLQYNYIRNREKGAGSGPQALNCQRVRELEFIVSEKKEQQEIVRILDDLLAKEQRIQQAVETILQQIDDTKKSILAKAFRGEWQTTLDNI